MTQPSSYLTRIVIFLVLVLVVIGVLHEPVIAAFMTNPVLNGLIIASLLIGIGYVLRQVLSLRPAVRWVETYRRNEPGLSMQAPPEMMSPLATMLQEKKGRVSLSATSMRSLLDSIGARLDESRDMTRYLGRLLIFLGLLGTFWGLIQTIDAVGNIFGGMSVGGGGGDTSFDDLMVRLNGPLQGLATAFSSSLFGLSGALVLGFLDLQAGQAQNRFYNDLEEWLSSFTRLSSGAGGIADGDASVPVYVQALLEQTADSLENLQRIMARSEDARASGNQTLLQLSERLASLTDQMRTERDLMVKLAEGQMELKPILQRIAVATEQNGGDSNADTHLRNLDVYVARLLEETSTGRQQSVDEIRSEIKVLTRTIAAIADEGR
ncbi:flagellar motor protein MotA [Minwuia sp.]|uniref:flagellar motor protein MotA n=1 Tax=Minwuia sp. TaxID=2493630 RepID=UPI003A930B9C